MKRKVLCFVLTLLAIAVFSIGCGGGGGHSNPASPVISGNAKVSGVVVDSNKKPVENVKVKLTLLSDSVSNNLPDVLKSSSRLVVNDIQTEFNTTTDKNGVYSFSNVPYGRYSLSADGGNVGGLRAVAIDGDTQESIPLTPFATLTGKVETTDETPVPVYGAMVNVKDSTLRSFTNNEGIFTLKYIPIDTSYQLVTTLQGYEAPTTSFTISASDLEYPEANNPTYSMVNSPIKVKASVVNTYTIPVKIETASGVTVTPPVFVVARDRNDRNNIFFSLVENNSCNLKITAPGSYNIFAIDSNETRTDSIGPVTVPDPVTDFETSEMTLTFKSSSSETEGKTVVVQKIALPTDSFDDNTLNYYDGYVSCTGEPGKIYYKALDSSAWSTFTYDSSLYYLPSNVCGKYTVYYQTMKDSSTGDTEAFDFSYLDFTSSEPVGTFEISSDSTGYNMGNNSTIYSGAFIPDNGFLVDYQDNNSTRHYLTVDYEETDGPVVVTENYDYGRNINDSECFPYGIKMAKASNGDLYVGIIHQTSSGFVFNLSKFKSSDVKSIPLNVDSSSSPEFKRFEILSDGRFYFEYWSNKSTSGSTSTSVTSCIYNSSDSSNPLQEDNTSNRVGCFVDSNGNIYRYDPNSKSIIKTTTLDGTAADSYKFEVTGTTTGSDTDVNGILTLTEDSDAITIYAY